MNDLTARLRRLAERLAHVDPDAGPHGDLSVEMVRQRIEDLEATVIYLFGDPDAAMPRGTVQAHATCTCPVNGYSTRCPVRGTDACRSTRKALPA